MINDIDEELLNVISKIDDEGDKNIIMAYIQNLINELKKPTRVKCFDCGNEFLISHEVE